MTLYQCVFSSIYLVSLRHSGSFYGRVERVLHSSKLHLGAKAFKRRARGKIVLSCIARQPCALAYLPACPEGDLLTCLPQASFETVWNRNRYRGAQLCPWYCRVWARTVGATGL